MCLLRLAGERAEQAPLARVVEECEANKKKPDGRRQRTAGRRPCGASPEQPQRPDGGGHEDRHHQQRFSFLLCPVHGSSSAVVYPERRGHVRHREEPALPPGDPAPRVPSRGAPSVHALPHPVVAHGSLPPAEGRGIMRILRRQANGHLLPRTFSEHTRSHVAST